MRKDGPGLEVQRAADDLRHPVFRGGEDVGVGRVALGGRALDVQSGGLRLWVARGLRMCISLAATDDPETASRGRHTLVVYVQVHVMQPLKLTPTRRVETCPLSFKQNWLDWSEA